MTESKFSVVILTLDEEINLASCIDSLSNCQDIVIFDSFSKDRTKAIAKGKGVRFFEREFDNYAAQRNAAMNEVEYANEWLLMLDADERLKPATINEINDFISTSGNDYSMARMRRKDYFNGSWLRRSSCYPTWFGRLLKKGEVRIERDVNEEYLTDGKVYHLRNHLSHFPFNKGIAWWFERHNTYSSMEAEKAINESEIKIPFKNLFSRDPVVRRKFLKWLSFRFPFRPYFIFLYLYFIRLGVLDGVNGLRYVRMRCIYEYMIDLKISERKRREKGKEL